MTKEEAIKNLNHIRADFLKYNKEDEKGIKIAVPLNSDDIHSIEMAIEALKQEPKTGHWMPSHIPESILDECSECGFSCGAFTFNYCPNCGAKMVEPQESEDKE